jgi:hypothetical protein
MRFLVVFFERLPRIFLLDFEFYKFFKRILTSINALGRALAQKQEHKKILEDLILNL